MHQHSLYTFAMKFGFFKSRTTPSALPTFTIPKWIEEDDDGPACQFLSPIKSAPRRLSDLQLRHLREHYLTVCELASLQDEEHRSGGTDLASLSEERNVLSLLRISARKFYTLESPGMPQTADRSQCNPFGENS